MDSCAVRRGAVHILDPVGPEAAESEAIEPEAREAPKRKPRR